MKGTGSRIWKWGKRILIHFFISTFLYYYFKMDKPAHYNNPVKQLVEW